MKTTIALLAVALGASISLQAANATDNRAGISNAAPATDISAAKKKKHPYGTTVYPRQYSYYYPPAFWPGDPSWQSPQMQRLRAANRCIIDLGYGRWEYCD